jgi:hypothetical protein
MWVQVDRYLEALGGKAVIEEDGQLVVACLGGRCVPLRVPDDVEMVRGRPYARAEVLLRVAGLAEAPHPGVGIEVGDLAPDFTLESLAGTQVRLSDYRGEKVLVFAWASW